jgi:hypothetical protein
MSDLRIDPSAIELRNSTWCLCGSLPSSERSGLGGSNHESRRTARTIVLALIPTSDSTTVPFALVAPRLSRVLAYRAVVSDFGPSLG